MSASKRSNSQQSPPAVQHFQSPNNNAPQGDNGFLTSLSTLAVTAASTAGKVATTAGGKGLHAVNVAGGYGKTAVLTTADAVGLKDKVEAAEKTLRRAAQKSLHDTGKAVNKARRLANKAFIFEDDEVSELISSDYDLLLSAAGAIQTGIAPFGNLSQTFEVPENCAIVWKARVKQHDIGFALREMPDATTYTQNNNNNSNTESNATVIQPLQRFSSEALIQGQLAPTDRHRNINLLFDNTHSHLQRKTIVFWVAIGENVSLADDQIGAARSKEVTAANQGPPLY